ncbi:MAG: anthranilate synthase component I [Chitinispirillaceae bacterium]
MLIPSLEKVEKAAVEANVIPVYKSVLADTETPVSVWMKLFQNEKYNFLLESVTGGDTVARYSFIGGDPYITFKADGEKWWMQGARTEKGTGDPVDAFRSLLSGYKPLHLKGMPRFCGGAVGYFSYDSIRLRENIPDNNPKEDPLHDCFFALYRNLIAFDNREHRLLLISNIILDEKRTVKEQYSEARESIALMEDNLTRRLPSPGITVDSSAAVNSNFEKKEYEKAVEKCKEYIKAGDIFQVVLSQRFQIEVDTDPFDLYRILRVVNPSPYMYYLSLDDTSVIGASPEMLVRVENGEVENRPIAGTRKRGKTDAEDEKLIKDLKSDPKEVAEHVMLVDLGRNDVGRVSEYGSVSVKNMMHMEKYSHVIHMVTDVKGKLKDGYDGFDALFSCFPAGTLSGAPKIRAMEIIDELEPVRRGLYGGTLGYIDFSGNMDTCIVIRTIIYHKGVASIQAGAGLVADSVPEKEYQETVHKASALFSAIQRAGEIIGA